MSVRCSSNPATGDTSSVSIVIGTYGFNHAWEKLALRAYDSAENQTVKPRDIVWVHGDTLQSARNEGVSYTSGEWLVHLDADDLLDEHYVEGILKGTGDLRQPKTLGFYEDGHTDAESVMIPRKSHFNQGNWLVVGTAVRRSVFLQAGGWGDEALYEDWALWWRCWLAGAEIGTAPEAIYKIMVKEGGRNLPARSQQVLWFERIVRELGNKTP